MHSVHMHNSSNSSGLTEKEGGQKEINNLDMHTKKDTSVMVLAGFVDQTS